VSESVNNTAKKELLLRDYQRQLHERTISAQQQGDSSLQRLAFMAGEYGLLVHMTDAKEIMAIPAVTRVPGTLDWFVGLSNYRGKLLSVIDLDCLITTKKNTSNKAERLVVLSDRFLFPCALQVTQICGLVDLNSTSIKASSKINHPWFDAEYSIDNKQWYELNLMRMQSDPIFLKAYADE
jgi:twitching motility protein PilI